MATQKTINFDQLACPVSEHYPIGHVALMNNLPFVGKVIEVNDEKKTATFKPASLEETAKQLRDLGMESSEEEYDNIIETQKKQL